MTAVEQKLTYNLKLALVYTSAIIRNLGYISKKRSMEGISGSGASPTSQVLARWLKANPDEVAVQVKPEDTVRADEALAWLAKLSPTNEFYQSLIKLNAGGYRSVDNGQITKSDFGFVACVFETMAREEFKKKARAVAEEKGFLSKEYIGKIKKRGDFFVKLLKVNYNDKLGCHIYNVKDRKGNLGLFFSNDSPSDLGLALEDCFLARMTPKRHSVSNYHGGKETVFNRIKVLENVGSPS
jgi:hypothetical protein